MKQEKYMKDVNYNIYHNEYQGSKNLSDISVPR